MTLTLQALKKLSYMYFLLGGLLFCVGISNLVRHDWWPGFLMLGQVIGFTSLGACAVLLRRMGMGLKEGALIEAKLQLMLQFNDRQFNDFPLPKGVGIPE